jgi:uncharacterized protein YbjT (DUF2867 family)
MKVILTGATGLVGEGVLLECLDNPLVEKVLSVSRRPSGRTHAKLSECLVSDFRHLDSARAQLSGYHACLYCAGISSVGMTEAQYTEVTYDTPLRFAEELLALNPEMVFCHVSGSHTDGTEKGRVMWARVKGKAENALLKMRFKAVYNFRPGLMKPTKGQRNVKGGYKVVSALYPVMGLILTGLTMSEVGKAMINAAALGAPKTVLEASDMKVLAQQAGVQPVAST